MILYKCHSRLLRVTVLSGGFLGGLQKIFQRVVLRDAEKSPLWASGRLRAMPLMSHCIT